MQQITLELDSDTDDRPCLTLEPGHEQQLIALMAQLIIAVVHNPVGDDHEPE